MTDPILLVVGAVLGLVIGMLGGGGGILAVPILVAIGQPVLEASTMSLVVVGTGAAAALVPHHRARRVDWPVGLTFGALGSVGAVIGAQLAKSTPPALLLGGLALLLVVGAVTMLRTGAHARRHDHDDDRADDAPPPTWAEPGPDATGMNRPSEPVQVELGTNERVLVDHHHHHHPDHDVPEPLLDAPALHDPVTPLAPGRVLSLRVIGLASVVGLVTGLFGVGAGFVVVPALVAAMRLPIKKATATALVVIVMNSAVALLVRYGELTNARETFELALLTGLFAAVGAVLSRRVPGWVLSTAFGVLMVGVAVFTVIKSLSLA